MMKIFFLVSSVVLFSFLAPAQASESCDPGKWRELSNEESVLKAHPNLIQRQGDKLEIRSAGGRSLTFEDVNPKEGGVFDLKRVIEVGPRDAWVSMLELRFDSMNYRVVHPQSGASEVLDGCPIWSGSKKYFAAVNHDEGSGQTRDEASLWYCAKPAKSCKRIWKGKSGAKSAQWSGDTLVMAVVQGDSVRKVRCGPRGASAHCK